MLMSKDMEKDIERHDKILAGVVDIAKKINEEANMELDIIYNEDCIGEKGMCIIPDKCIDMILCDLPYGTTACSWDTIIPFEPLWKQYKRIIKDEGSIILFGRQPFTSFLIVSNIEWFRYCWIWNKHRAANFIFANRQPLRITEDICVFYNKQPTYNPQKVRNPKGIEKRSFYRESNGKQALDIMPTRDKKVKHGQNYEPDKLLPITLLSFKRDNKPMHPTQKPVALFRYLIKTYTNEGNIVLDNCIGSGTTAVACKQLGRHYIGFEISEKYCEIAKQRLEQEKTLWDIQKEKTNYIKR